MRTIYKIQKVEYKTLFNNLLVKILYDYKIKTIYKNRWFLKY